MHTPLRPYHPALNALGLIIMIFGLLMGFPLVVSAWVGDGATLAYDQALFVTFVAGLLLWATTRSQRRDLRVHDGFLLVASTWVVLPLFGALPLLAYIPELRFTDAYFEAVSGLTATGATVLTGLDELPLSINLWRTAILNVTAYIRYSLFLSLKSWLLCKPIIMRAPLLTMVTMYNAIIRTTRSLLWNGKISPIYSIGGPLCP